MDFKSRVIVIHNLINQNKLSEALTKCQNLSKKFPNNKGLIVFGKGSGHGVGMSQWGAKYMASNGQKAEKILKHFYKGVQIKPFKKEYL